MKKGRLYDKNEISFISKSILGKSINDILKEDNLNSLDSNSLNKGGLGQMIEQFVFGINTNSESEPDFMPAGIELKVTPYKKIKGDKLSAKERLVLNIIDYMSEYKKTFRNSHFWFKNNTIQLLWYFWEPNTDVKNLKITHEKILDLSNNEDFKQIEEDWNYIIKRIKEGKAHELSEADTMYLGACSKGASSKSVRKQPFSNVPAMQRAFCLKNSYMTQLVRKYIGDYSAVEKILKTTDNSFSEFVDSVISKYKGKTQKELMKEFNIDSNSKNINNMLVSRMFNVKSKLAETEEFQKSNMVPKTIRIEENGNIKESISFPAFKYTDIITQEWENSNLREMLETTKYMFFLFKKENQEYVFKGIKIWNMPVNDIETEVLDMWNKTRNTIKSGKIVKYIQDGKRKTNFVSMSENRVCHVRPHGRDSKDTYILPVPDKLTGLTEYTKQSFWINNSYIREIFKDFNN